MECTSDKVRNWEQQHSAQSQRNEHEPMREKVTKKSQQTERLAHFQFQGPGVFDHADRICWVPCAWRADWWKPKILLRRVVRGTLNSLAILLTFLSKRLSLRAEIALLMSSSVQVFSWHDRNLPWPCTTSDKERDVTTGDDQQRRVLTRIVAELKNWAVISPPQCFLIYTSTTNRNTFGI